ncbi:YHYH domain-containing protein [Halomonas titanicae]|nr:YHYH domain-containing protein [Halomonas titanicae]
MKKVLFSLILAGMFFGAGSVSASSAAYSGDVVSHSGGTDKNGCHRDTKAGTRYCH